MMRRLAQLNCCSLNVLHNLPQRLGQSDPHKGLGTLNSGLAAVLLNRHSEKLRIGKTVRVAIGEAPLSGWERRILFLRRNW
jgi:hypothetical protein